MSEEPNKNSFEQAGQEQEMSLMQEVMQMLKHNKKYWMIPIILVLLVFGVILLLGATGAAPFIYTLF